MVESPSYVLELLKTPLKEQGISYDTMQGGFLSGFVLTEVNYQDKAKIKEVRLKVDVNALKNRILIVDNVILKDVQIDKDFLASLIDGNSSQETNSSTEGTLPFDRVLVKNADISLENTIYQGYKVNHAWLQIKNVRSDLKTKHQAEVTFLLDSNVTQADIKGKFKNNTYDFVVNIEGEKVFLAPFVTEQNIHFLSNPKLTIEAEGNLDEVDYKVTVHRLDLKQNENTLKSQLLNAFGHYSIKNNDLKTILKTKLDSNMAHLNLDADAHVDLDDINHTLTFDSHTTIDAHDGYLNQLLKDANVTLSGDTKITLDAKGGMNALTAQLNASGHVLAQKILSAMTIETTPISLNLKTHQVEGSVKVDSNAKNMVFNLNSNFVGDYMNPKKLKTKSRLKVMQFNAFSVNLTSLVPLMLNVDNSELGAVVNLDSKKIQLHVKSSDYDKVGFDIQTDKLYLSQIITLPPEVEKNFIKLDLKGDVTLSKEYFSLKGVVESNQKFKANIHAQNSAKGLDAHIATEHLKIDAQGDVKAKKMQSTVAIDSVLELQKELVRLYPFTLTEVDGPLLLNTSLNGEAVHAHIVSSKLKLEDFNIEAIDIDADYKDELVTLNRFNLKTTGLKDKTLNQSFYLNQKGLIHLGEQRDVVLDIHPNIFVTAKGNAENLNGKFTIKKLPLSYPDYGSVVLNCDIKYQQTGQKKKILGSIDLEKLKLMYEAKFLDPDNDPDVVVITKKDKNKKPKSDTFLEDTFMDIAIYAPYAQYKTRDIDLKFNVNVRAKKEFAKSVRVLGKIENIEGRVEQAPKLFTVVNSNIVFTGSKEINPLLDIKVEHELPDILINIAIHGDANRPKLDFSSEPLLPKKEILSYLLFGVSTASIGKGEASLGREAQLFIMNQAARDLAYEVELDRVFVKDDGTGEGYAVQVGKKIREDTMFVIENSQVGNAYILEYDVNKNIKVDIGQHQKAVPSQSMDVFFRKKFK